MTPEAVRKHTLCSVCGNILFDGEIDCLYCQAGEQDELQQNVRDYGAFAVAYWEWLKGARP